MKEGQVKSILVSVKDEMTNIQESKIDFQFQYVDQKMDETCCLLSNLLLLLAKPAGLYTS